MTIGHPLFHAILGYYNLFNDGFRYSLIDIQRNVSINHAMHDGAAPNEDEYNVHQVDIWQRRSRIK